MRLRLFFLFFFLIAVLCSWNGGKAQADRATPVAIQGHWASPDCGKYTEGVIFSRYFYLNTSKNGMSLLPYTPAGKGGDYMILELGGEKRPFQRTEDGVLKLGLYGEESKPRAKSWDDLALDSHMEYTNCPEAPKLIPKAMLRLMRYIDRIHDACQIGISNDCARVMYKTADIDGNNKITPSEIKRSIASAMLLAELADKGSLDKKQMEETAARAKKAGDEISALLMEKQDADKSGALDYNESVEKFEAPPLPVIKEMAAKIGNLLPAFKLAAAALD